MAISWRRFVDLLDSLGERFKMFALSLLLQIVVESTTAQQRSQLKSPDSNRDRSTTKRSNDQSETDAVSPCDLQADAIANPKEQHVTWLERLQATLQTPQFVSLPRAISASIKLSPRFNQTPIQPSTDKPIPHIRSSDNGHPPHLRRRGRPQLQEGAVRRHPRQRLQRQQLRRRAPVRAPLSPTFLRRTTDWAKSLTLKNES